MIYFLIYFWKGLRILSFYEQDNIELTTEEIENCRHKSEKKWYGILLFINFAIIITVIAFCIINIHNYNTLPDTLKRIFSDPLHMQM